MKLSEKMIEAGIAVGNVGAPKTKEGIISELVDLAARIYGLDEAQKQKVLSAVVNREAQRSTGSGCGLAVPHCKVDCVDSMHVLAMACRDGVDFNAIDKEPVYLLFLIISPENTAGPHLTALSSVARLAADAEVRQALIDADTPARFLEVLKNAENKYA